METENNMWYMIAESIRRDSQDFQYSQGSLIIRHNIGLNNLLIYEGPPFDGIGIATLLVGNKPDIHPYGLQEEFYFTGKFSNGEFVDDLCIICTIDINYYGFFSQKEKIIGKIINGKFVRVQTY